MKQTAPAKPILMTAEDIAFEIRRSVRTVQRMISNGEFAQVKRQGKRYLVPRWAFETYVDSLPEV